MFWRCYDYQMYIKHVFLESCDSPTWQWLTNLPTMYFLLVGQQFTWKRAFVTDFVFLWHTISYETDFFWVQNLGESLKDEEIEGLLDEGDLEGDGFISYMDFSAIKNLMWKPMSKIYIYENLPTASQSKKHHCCKCKTISLFLRLPQLNCKASHKCALSCVSSK